MKIRIKKIITQEIIKLKIILILSFKLKNNNKSLEIG
jgi:hypothetical protein